jgi:hypothetical protein
MMRLDTSTGQLCRCARAIIETDFIHRKWYRLACRECDHVGPWERTKTEAREKFQRQHRPK